MLRFYNILMVVLYQARYLVLVTFLFNCLSYFTDVPTQALVNQASFELTVYGISWSAGLFIRRLFNAHLIFLIIIMLVVPMVYLEFAQLRYDGGVNNEFKNVFTIALWAMIVNGLLWLFSMKPLSIMFRTRFHQKAIRDLNKLKYL